MDHRTSKLLSNEGQPSHLKYISRVKTLSNPTRRAEHGTRTEAAWSRHEAQSRPNIGPGELSVEREPVYRAGIWTEYFAGFAAGCDRRAFRRH